MDYKRLTWRDILNILMSLNDKELDDYAVVTVDNINGIFEKLDVIQYPPDPGREPPCKPIMQLNTLY
jgi:hypothetical protein